MNRNITIFLELILFLSAQAQSFNSFPVTTQKPPLHARHWMAITGKPLAATAGAKLLFRVEMPLMPHVLCLLPPAPCGMYLVGEAKHRL